jgi:hypothetical protein
MPRWGIMVRKDGCLKKDNTILNRNQKKIRISEGRSENLDLE